MDFANATRQYKLKLGFSLSGTREKNLLRLTSGLDGVMKLASRRNFKPASPREKMPEHHPVRIGFHRETDFESLRQGIAQRVDFCVHHLLVVHEARSAVLFRKQIGRASCRERV